MGPDYIVLPTARDSLQVKVKEEEKRKCFLSIFFLLFMSEIKSFIYSGFVHRYHLVDIVLF